MRITPIMEGRLRLESPEGAPAQAVSLHLACYGGGGGGQTTSSTSTIQTDNRVTTESGEILELRDSTLNVSDGGAVNIITKDPAAALSAINAIRESTNTVADVLANVARGSNEIAANVAASQEQFVAQASGNKTLTTGLLVIGGVLAFLALRKNS